MLHSTSSISILCGQWYQTSGVTLNVTKTHWYRYTNVSTNSIKIDEMVKRDASSDNMFVDAAVPTSMDLKLTRHLNAKKDLKNMVGITREVTVIPPVKRDKRGALRITKRN